MADRNLGTLQVKVKAQNALQHRRPMPAPGWKYYTIVFAVVSGMPVFCYWYYSLPSVIDRYTKKWMIEQPEKENIEFQEFMKELSAKKHKKEHDELVKRAAEEERRRAAAAAATVLSR